MKTFAALSFAVLAVTVTPGYAEEELGTLNRGPIDEYDCTGLENGNYDHYDDCTRFISCSNGFAYERDCATCHYDPVTCPWNDKLRLVFNMDENKCLFANETECTTNPRPPTGPPPTSPPGDGGDDNRCNLKECKHTGTCHKWRRCEKVEGQNDGWGEWGAWEDCGDEFYWDPTFNPEQGGQCVHIDDINEEVLEGYRNSKDCLACHWSKIQDCHTQFLYQAPNLRVPEVKTLNCPRKTLFDPTKETCLPCGIVRDEAGQLCVCT